VLNDAKELIQGEELANIKQGLRRLKDMSRNMVEGQPHRL